MSRFYRSARCVFFLLALIPLGCGQPATEAVPIAADASVEDPAPRNDGPFEVTQPSTPDYQPGSEYAATVTMDYRGTDRVTALALQLKLPLGWEFGTLVDGPKPAIVPDTGTTDTVTLVWITAPEFPATLTYTVTVPDWAEGTLTLEAQAIYRALSGELRSKPSAAQVKNAL